MTEKCTCKYCGEKVDPWLVCMSPKCVEGRHMKHLMQARPTEEASGRPEDLLNLSDYIPNAAVISTTPEPPAAPGEVTEPLTKQLDSLSNCINILNSCDNCDEFEMSFKEVFEAINRVVKKMG